MKAAVGGWHRVLFLSGGYCIYVVKLTGLLRYAVILCMSKAEEHRQSGGMVHTTIRSSTPIAASASSEALQLMDFLLRHCCLWSKGG